MDIPTRVERSVSRTVAHQLRVALDNRGLLLPPDRLTAVEAELDRLGADLRAQLLKQCYPWLPTGSSAFHFEGEHTSARLDGALAFGAVTGRMLAYRAPESSVELLCAAFNLGIGLVDSVCDEDDAEVGAALLGRIAAADPVGAALTERRRGWLRLALGPPLAADPTVAFTADVIEVFYELLHLVYPGNACARHRSDIGGRLAAALEAEKRSVDRRTGSPSREELVACSRLTSVLPFEILASLAGEPDSPAAEQIGEALWRIDDLVDLCEDARRGALNGVLLAAAPGAGRQSERDVFLTLERLVGSADIARAAAEAAEQLQAALSPEDDGRRPGAESFLYFVQRYAGIAPVTPQSAGESAPTVSITSSSSASSTGRSTTGGM